ncbi:PREDICTED: histone deacetylase 11 isoform X2 [Nicrophorus vespilloides]|uniref:Histone deacetylase 11 isoform X1 n=1 Tax=Nicrophorus vespilloides TaxID=110193 RepID=A0ABM1MMJ4_NICVS|nr:PREDICTED: histone deacetylase 11 isoform X1 [Nicrophorus vespilloides]XP_017775801.1 PREDICTED: histone deacetylase 11 isoform X2 [Nicrophorus vespilloides]
MSELLFQSGDEETTKKTKLYFDIDEEQWPIIYRPEYNVHFWGLEKLHPFDAGKWGHVYEFLKEAGLFKTFPVVKPNEAKYKDLLLVHSKEYLKSLRCSLTVACIVEVPPLCLVPNYFLQKRYLKKMRYQVGGSVLAGKIALERGYAINIGGGFHHCSSKEGGGFCAYADITLLIEFLFNCYPEQVKDVMIIDLDAHQGNGYERDFLTNTHVYILDAYNRSIYPRDAVAKAAINRKVELKFMIDDIEYLTKIEANVDRALTDFKPNLVVYNAGTDILIGDSLGGLAISAEGIIKRDEMVFRKVTAKDIPIVMLTSGGYLKKTARIIADSIMNLNEKGLLQKPKHRY